MNKTKTFLIIIFCSLAFEGVSYPQTFSNYNVKDFGAVGDAKSYDTESIQNAIDYASINGGGTIHFPAGHYLTRTLILKDNISLYLDNGCIILGSTDLKKYDEKLGGFTDSGGQKMGVSLFFANQCKNISIEGNGIIDGQGFETFYPVNKEYARPSIIRFQKCNFVRIKNITLINSAAWVQHYISCDDLLIDGITVRSYSNKNNDGIDIESCQRVTITRCNIDSEDDSIVLKALTPRACKDIVISDCIVSGLKSAIKTGTESVGNFENITISNCTFYGTRGINLLAVDGGSINNVTVSNISMRGSYAVIVMRLGARMRKYSVPDSLLPRTPGTFKNIMISNIQADSVTSSYDFISGIPGHMIENITLNNIRINYLGGGKAEEFKKIIPEYVDEYPKESMFGNLPSYGFFIRHAKDIAVKDLFISYGTTEERPVIFCDDVENLSLIGVNGKTPVGSVPYFFFNNTANIVIANCQPRGELKTFAQFNGAETRKIKLYRNYLDDDVNVFTANPGVDLKEVLLIK